MGSVPPQLDEILILLRNKAMKWPYGVMVSHQLDVLRVPRSILGEANLFNSKTHFSLSSSSRLLSCLFPHPFLFAFCWVATAKTPAHPAQPAPADTHMWARVLCFFVSDVSGVCSRLFFAVLWFFGFCGFFACLLFSLVTSAGLAPF